MLTTDLDDSKWKIEDLIKENKNLVSNNKNINEKFNETDPKRMNVGKAVRITKDESNDLKTDIEKLSDEIYRLEEQQNNNKDELQQLKWN